MSKLNMKPADVVNWWRVVQIMKHCKVPAGSRKDIQFGYSAGYYAALQQLTEVSRCHEELLKNFAESHAAALEDIEDQLPDFLNRRGPVEPTS